MRFPTRDELETGQLRSLRAMLAEILPQNRFQRERLTPVGIDAEIPSLAHFFQNTPFSTKQELVDDQLRNPPYGTNLTYPVEHYTRYHQTSGTTGRPMRWLDTPQSWDWAVGNWMEVYRASGVLPGERIFFAFSFGPFLGFWTAFDAGWKYGCLCLPGGGMSSAARIRAIVDNEATVLCCTPTYAIRLGEVAADEGIDLSAGPVKTIIVAGEPGAGIPATRARMERMWPGAKIRDHHGMTETGPVSFECPANRGRLHVIGESFLAEAIDPRTDEPIPPGDEGELVLTNLGRWGSPLLRYRTGDLVKFSTETLCPCGRADIGLDGGILGRTDDMVVVRGVNVHPSAVEGVLRAFEDVVEYQVVTNASESLTEVGVCVELSAACKSPAAIRDEIETALRVAFNLRIPVNLAEQGALPRFELKANRWVRK